jgi:Ser/Thr protein kinase RdoA (MazF antagonist)
MAQPYQNLTPDCVIDAVESCGHRCDGRLLALNSYENRVYLVYMEEAAPLVAKFYRPERWSDEAIGEEHAFARELEEREIPVVAPMEHEGRSLHRHAGYRFALYPRRPGRSPEFEDVATLTWLGRFVARIHAVGAITEFRHRPRFDVESFGREPSHFVIENDFIPPDLRDTYRSVIDDLLERVTRCFERAGNVHNIRLHGDCHAGNILWTEQGPHFVDLDDARSGPAIQDLWMCLSGERSTMEQQLSALMAGYREFRDFNVSELVLVEALRTLRMVHYAGWLARRWDDPAFPANFPFFNTQRYWQDHILALREQAALLDEPPLELIV